MKKLAVVAHPEDNVATAVQNLSKNEEVLVDVNGKELRIKLIDNIPFGHKFALKEIEMGANVVKYGEVIGRATKSIKVGEHVHVHNIESLRGRGDWEGDVK
ncbi:MULTISPECIES: UxaA family hydrolase [Carboxydothermus]|uniref:Hydrolase, UxaA family n=2 Tax=Carboxydothermus TaxID=129957 RepID=Q3ACP5_CARHZ|nr:MULTISPECIES: UxaA family hydrolase [Carboxydothermus]ABB13806.1 hydrolase, UxaA family [Carboxydothermus hydrogenoformans Z-2901]NYE58066.1 altronate dehydratase small subunit [Carboxydothermus ferrireducens DSM 11255]